MPSILAAVTADLPTFLVLPFVVLLVLMAVLAGAGGQEKKKDGKYPEFGRLKLYKLIV